MLNYWFVSNLDISTSDLSELPSHMSGLSEGNFMIGSIFQHSNWLLHRYSSALLPLQQSVHLHTYLLENSWDKCSVLKNTNYNKFIHILINFIHKQQIQLLTISVFRTFLSFAAQTVFYKTLSLIENYFINIWNWEEIILIL